MSAQIVVDDREEALQQALVHVLREDASERQRALVQLLPSERLVLGDVQLSRPGGVVDVLVERKRHDDLLHSTFDGRLADQIQRM